MRALLRPLSLHTVHSPIEVIVFVFVLATLAYFFTEQLSKSRRFQSSQ